VLSTAILSYLICHMLHIVQNLSYWALSNICHSMMEIPALLYILCYNFSRLCYQCSNMSKHCTYKSYMFKHCTFYSIIIQTSSNNQIPLQIHHYLNTHTLRGDTLPALTQLLQLSAPTNIVQMPLKIIDFIPCLPFSSSSMSHCIWHVH
jgi:hypothetical protein